MDNQPDLILPGIPSLRELTKHASKPRVARALSYYEIYKAQKELRPDIKPIWGNKADMLDNVYIGLFQPCNCQALEGTRWHKSDSLQSITVAQDPNDSPIYNRYLEEQRAAFKLWERNSKNLSFDFLPANVENPDIRVRFRPIDREGGTLGMTVRLREGDLGRANRSVDVTIDTLETWNSFYFFTVFAHEIGHALGHPHYDRQNLMYWRFDGNRDTLGNIDTLENHKRYGVPLLAA